MHAVTGRSILETTLAVAAMLAADCELLYDQTWPFAA